MLYLSNKSITIKMYLKHPEYVHNLQKSVKLKSQQGWFFFCLIILCA